MRTRARSAAPKGGFVYGLHHEKPYPPDLPYARTWHYDYPGWWHEPQIGKYEWMNDDAEPKPNYWELWPDKGCAQAVTKGQQVSGHISWSPGEDGDWYGVSGQDTMDVYYTLPAFAVNESLSHLQGVDSDFHKLAHRAQRAGRRAANIKQANMCVWLGEASSALLGMRGVANRMIDRAQDMLAKWSVVRFPTAIDPAVTKLNWPAIRYAVRRYIRQFGSNGQALRDLALAGEAASAAVLSYDWGINPAIQDLKQAVLNSSAAMHKARKLVERQGRLKTSVRDFKTLAEAEAALPETIPFTHQLIYNAGTLGRSLGVYAETSVVMTTHTTLPSGEDWGADTEVYKQYIAWLMQARAFGLTNIPKSMWNLAPTSFMVDWLVGASSLLDVATEHGGLTTGITGCTTHRHVSKSYEVRLYVEGLNRRQKSRNGGGGELHFYKRWAGLPPYGGGEEPSKLEDLITNPGWWRDMVAFYWLNRVELNHALGTLASLGSSLGTLAQYAYCVAFAKVVGEELGRTTHPIVSPSSINGLALEPPSLAIPSKSRVSAKYQTAITSSPLFPFSY